MQSLNASPRVKTINGTFKAEHQKRWRRAVPSQWPQCIWGQCKNNPGDDLLRLRTRQRSATGTHYQGCFSTHCFGRVSIRRSSTLERSRKISGENSTAPRSHSANPGKDFPSPSSSPYKNLVGKCNPHTVLVSEKTIKSSLLYPRKESTMDTKNKLTSLLGKLLY